MKALKRLRHRGWKRGAGNLRRASGRDKPAATAGGGKALKGGHTAAASGATPRPGRAAKMAQADGGEGRRFPPLPAAPASRPDPRGQVPENLRRAIAGVAPREEADDEDSQDGPTSPSPPFGTANPDRLGASAAPPSLHPRSRIGAAYGPAAQGRAGMHAPRAPYASRATAPSERPRARPTSDEERPGGHPREVVCPSQSSGEARSLSCSTPRRYKRRRS